MTEFKTDISENGKKFELVFQTDNKAYFEKMQAMARECIDNKSVTQFNRIKAMSVEDMADALFAFKECNKDCPIGKNRKYCYMLCDSESAIKKWLESEVSE